MVQILKAEVISRIHHLTGIAPNKFYQSLSQGWCETGVLEIWTVNLLYINSKMNVIIHPHASVGNLQSLTLPIP